MSNRSLEAIIESLASEVVIADPHDLQAVSRVMDLLKEVEQEAEGDAEEFLKSMAQKALELTEDMIVQSPDEASGTLENVGKVISALQVARKNGVERALKELPAGLAPEIEAVPEAAQCVDERILDDFLSRQDSFLEELEAYILKVEKKGLTGKPLSEIKRILHTLKGETGMLGLNESQEVCHETENYLASEPGDDFADVLFSVKDWLMRTFESYAAGNKQHPSSDSLLKTLRGDPGSTGKTEQNIKSEPVETEGKTTLDESSVAEKREEERQEEIQDESVDKDTPPALTLVETEPKILDVSEEDASLFWDFIQESRSHLDNADVQLLNIEQDPEDKESLNAIFRSFHTIKGVSGFLDLMDIKELAHIAEDALDRARKGRLLLADKAIDLVFESVDTLRKLINSVEEAITNKQPMFVEPSLSGLMQNLKNLLDGKEVNVQDRHIEVEPEKKLGEILLEGGKIPADKLNSLLAEKESTAKLGEVLVKKGQVPAQDVAGALRAQKNARAASMEQGKVKETVKIDTERLDRLIDAIGELVIAESMVGQNEEIVSQLSTESARNMNHLHKITRVVQELGMSMRMVPIRPTFQKMARLVRDLSRKAGKKVDFITSGEETELDRSVVERIGDPLIHIIRNSVDHGLEDNEADRVKAGKPAVGTVELKAFHRGGSIFIEVSDDGRGLNRDAILKKAIERGIVSEGCDMSEREINNLVFMAGFSTAKKVTDISGRGVGMDVVKKNVEALRGSIELFTTPGQGTTVSMRLPLTLAIIDGMIISVGEERYIVPTLSVVESLRPERENVSTVSGRGELLNVRGQLIPLFRVSRIFNIKMAKENTSEALAMIVEDQGNRVALLVDNLIGQQQVVIKSLGEGTGHVEGISGGAIMADGNVGLILDISGIIRITSGNGKSATANVA